ncbi:MAG: branched-chain amino acid ABC transporter permease [Chloroflexi bacterium]|nr:branched-chain amino acid ABC transporter permease [Chloroflexota bacterium]
MKLPRKFTEYAILIIIIVTIFIVPHFVSSFGIHFFIILTMYAIMAIAWNWVGGYAGQVSVGHAVYFGIGAYSTAIVQEMFKLNPWFGLLTGVLVALLFSLAVGLPTLRLSGRYFVISTLAIGEIMYSLVMGWDFVGGGGGIYIKKIFYSFRSLTFTNIISYFYLIFAFFLLSTVLTIWLENSKLGFYLRAIKGDDEGARALGVDLRTNKQIALSMSAMMTAICGVFWVNYASFIDPESAFINTISVRILLMAAVGGTGTALGPVLGALIIIPLTESSRVLFGSSGRGLDLLIYGFLIMIIAVAQPRGIMGLFNRLSKPQKIDQELIT